MHGEAGRGIRPTLLILEHALLVGGDLSRRLLRRGQRHRGRVTQPPRLELPSLPHERRLHPLSVGGLQGLGQGGHRVGDDRRVASGDRTLGQGSFGRAETVVEGSREGNLAGCDPTA